MAKLNFRNLNFTPSAGAVDHRLRFFPSNQPAPDPSAVYDAPFASVGVDGVVDQAEVQGLGGANIDGLFDLYLTAVDENGNESDFAVKSGVPLDLVAPNAPVWL